MKENQERVIQDLMEIFGIKSPSTIIDESTYMEQQRSVYPNAYKPWTESDDERLVALYNEGKSISELAQMFLRNHGAIKSRIRKLTGERF